MPPPDEADPSDAGRVRGSRKRRRPSRAGRRALFLAALILLLVVVNGWIFRRQFPSDARRANAAYDAGLRALAQEAQPVTAIEELQKVVELAPERRRARYLLGLALLRNGAPADARAVLLDLARDAPQDDSARLLLAAVAYEEEDFAEALGHLAEALRRSPTPALAYRMKGHVLARGGNLVAADDVLTEAVVVRRGDPQLWLELGDIRLARALEAGTTARRDAAGDAYATAEQLLLERLAKDPRAEDRIALARAIAGQTRATATRSVAEATSELERVIEETGGATSARVVLAEFHFATGNLLAAEQALDRALASEPTPEAYAIRFAVRLERGEPEDAEAALRAALSLRPLDPRLTRELVEFLEGAGREPEADAELVALTVSLPAAAWVAELRGDVARARARAAEDGGDDARAREQRAAALAAYREAKTLRPRSMPLRKKLSGEVLEASVGGVEVSPEDLREARQYLESVLMLSPGDVEASSWLAALRLAEGDAAAALSVLQPVLDAEDAPPIPVLRVGAHALASVGRGSEALEAFVALIDRQIRRGDPQRRDDRAAQARDWEAALRVAVSEEEVETARRLGEEAIVAWPGRLELRVLLANAHLVDGRRDRALETLRDVPATMADEPRLVRLRAALLETTGRVREAEAVLRAGGPALSEEHLSLLARLGRANDAVEQWQAKLAAAPDDAGLRLRHAAFLLSLRPARVAAAELALAVAERSGGAPDEVALWRAETVLFRAARGEASLTDVRRAVILHKSVAPGSAPVHYLAGKLALLEGRAEDAADRFSRWVRAGGSSVAGHYFRAAALRAAGRPGDAQAALRLALRLAPSDARLQSEADVILVHAALEAAADGRHAQAILTLDDAPGEHTGLGAELVRAASRLALGDDKAAEEHLRGVLRAAPRQPVATRALASLLLRRGDADDLLEARGVLRGLVEKDPADAASRAALAAALLAAGDGGGARAELDVLLAERPGSAAIVAARVTAALQDGDEADALATVDGALGVESASADLHVLRGDLLVRLRRPGDAPKAYRAALAIEPTRTDALLGAAAALVGSDRPDDAIVLLERHAEGCSRPALALSVLGELRLLRGDPARAEAALMKATTLETGLVRATLLLGRVAEVRGDRVRARQLYAAVLNAEPRNLDALLRLARLTPRDEIGGRRRAVELYTAALAIRPDDPAILNNRAALRAQDDGELDAALRDAQRAADGDPESPHIADTLGWVLLLDARAAEAYPVLERAVRGLPDVAIVRFHAGLAAARVGEVEKARAHLERALEIDPEFAGADVARQQLDRLR